MFKKIAIVVICLALIVAGGLAIKKYCFPPQDVEITEYFMDITWDMSKRKVKELLYEKGYIPEPHPLDMLIYEIEDFGGFEGANARMVINYDNENEKMIILSFNNEKMSEDEVNEFAEACMYKLDSICDKKLELTELLEYGGTVYNKEGKEGQEYKNMLYFLGESAITIIYYEDEKIMITYGPKDSEYHQMMLQFAE